MRATTVDVAVFGGSARRWYVAEPCHPFLAMSRTRYANPIVLIDEDEEGGDQNRPGSFLGFAPRLDGVRDGRAIS